MMKFLFAVMMALAGASFGATTEIWFAPKYTGTHAGTQAQPFRSLGNTEWVTVNAALDAGPVICHFPGRQSGSDIQEVHSATGSATADLIDWTKRTSTSANTLTIEGTQYYTTSDVTPNFVANTGTNLCLVLKVFAQNGTLTKYSNLTLRGLEIGTPGDSKMVSICGDNMLVEGCNLHHTSNVGGGGPGVLIVPTADAPHEGSGNPAPVCTNIVIRLNWIHDTEGEAIYVGGGGTVPGEAGSGYPSHKYITIEQNTITRAGFYGQQGDGIDIKGGIEMLTVRSNDISNIGLGAGNVARGIVAQGLYLVTGDIRIFQANKIWGCTNIDDAAFSLVDSWGKQQNVSIVDQLIYNCGRNGGQAGIEVYTTDGTISIINATIVGCDGPALYLNTGCTAIVKNGLFSGNNAGGSQVAYNAATITASDYNGWVGSSFGYGSEGAHSFSTTAALNFVNAAGNNYHLLSSARAKGAGIAVSGVTTDADGVTFASPPSVGAFEYVAAAPVSAWSVTGKRTRTGKFSTR